VVLMGGPSGRVVDGDAIREYVETANGGKEGSQSRCQPGVRSAGRDVVDVRARCGSGVTPDTGTAWASPLSRCRK
jgi:hypothetical protein